MENPKYKYAELPIISIVVPNFNNGATLGRALQSLVDQNYPALEIVVVDGGSTDNSLEIISEFKAHIYWWVSEKDRGQANAINKGLVHCHGQIVNWLCGDDELTPGTLSFVQEFFSTNPDAQWLVGGCEMIYPEKPHRNFIFQPPPDTWKLMPSFNGIMQPSSFWRRSITSRWPLVDASFNYALDAELWCHFKECGARPVLTKRVLSRFIQTGDNKTAVGGREIGLELERLYRRYTEDRIPLSTWYRHLRYPFELRLRRDQGWLCLGFLRILQMCYILCLAPFYGWRRVWKMSWPS